MQDSKPAGRLTALELAAIDLTITALQAAGHSINDVTKDDDPRQQQHHAQQLDRGDRLAKQPPRDGVAVEHLDQDRARRDALHGETLQSVATKTFGTPGAWRAIAEVNGIDDPTSLRPGDVIYLPARDELRPLAEASR